MLPGALRCEMKEERRGTRDPLAWLRSPGLDDLVMLAEPPPRGKAAGATHARA